MKVLFLVSGIGPPAGWGTEFIQNLIFKLSKKGIRTTIINPIYKHTHPHWKNWSAQIEKKYNIRLISLEAPNWIKKRLLLHFALTPFFVTATALKLLSQEKFDLVHEFSSTPIILFRALLFKILFATPTVFTLSVYNNTILGRLFWIKFFNLAKYYLIPSHKLIKNLVALGIKRKKIIYSPPGIDLKPFQKKIDQFHSREKLNLPKDKFIFSYFGSLTKEKGVYGLIRAAELINKLIREKIYITLFAIWKGSKEHKRIREEIKFLGLPHLSVVDRYVHIPTLLAASNAIVLPLRTGHGATIPPISIIETLASRKPLITTDIPISQEWIKGTNSIIIPPDNAEKLARAMKKVFIQRNFKFKSKMLTNLEINKSVSLYFAIYGSILKTKSSFLK